MWITIFLIFFIIVLLGIIGLLSKALFIQIKKNDIHEKWIIDLQTKVEHIYDTITYLDNKQMFSKDDEVGSVFQEIVDLIKSLDQMISKE
jgi:hypothetical protein